MFGARNFSFLALDNKSRIVTEKLGQTIAVYYLEFTVLKKKYVISRAFSHF